MHTCTPMRSQSYNENLTGAMVFNCDMFMDVKLLSDLDAIRGRKQQQIDDNNKQSNKGRIDNNYQVGEMVKL